jgi:hypothetical protein
VSTITGGLTNFKEAKAYYRQKVLEGNHELSHVYTGGSGVKGIFSQMFPELVLGCP